MSKSARKRRPVTRRPDSHRETQGRGRQVRPPKEKLLSPEKQEKVKHIVVLVVIAILAAIPFSLGKYFEFSTPGAWDSGGYVYSAAHILSGAKIGVDEKSSAQLGTLLVNILGVRLFGFSETGPKLMQTILQVTALLLMFITMRKLFGVMAAAVGVIVASIYLSAPLMAQVGNVKEQYMIAFMVIGISCFVMYQLSGKWWQAVLAGAAISWAPLFKQTGVSAMGAIGLFVILQPLLKNKTWKQTGKDILLLFAGAVAGISPLYFWILAWHVQTALPYEFIWQTLVKLLPASAETEQAQAALDYVSRSRKLVPFSRHWPRVLRYYSWLILPISLAAGVIAVRIVRMVQSTISKDKKEVKVYDRFVLLLGVWWILDMAFVWISPRSYQQYYLPLNASAAMLGGYLIAIYYDKAKNAASRPKWIAIGMLGFVLMIIMSWHIFFGVQTKAFSGLKTGRREKGYAQSLKLVSLCRKGIVNIPWERVGEYIHAHSEPTDKIYVWGWVPGIYVKAQRFSAATKACCLPRPAPPVLAEIVEELLTEFKQEMPKFIVDTRKRHIPTDRPPYELWPIVRWQGAKREGFLELDENIITRYEKDWAEILRRDIDEDEAERFKVLAPLRQFVMENYTIAEPKQYRLTKDGRLAHNMFGNHVVFKRK